MQFIRTLSRLIVGLVFIFSGFVKCIDPLGTAYKISDYLTAFTMDGLSDYALLLSILMCGIELLIGLMLVLNVKIILTAWITLIFMTFYTVLTFIVALTNPVTDCGCFGDALILTNWQTFGKNIVLMILTVIIFVYRKKYTELLNPFLGWMLLLGLAILVFGFEIYSLNRLPIKDFRPYKIGVNIKESMEIPEGAAQAEIESIFIYEKDGIKQEFTINNLPDGTWTFVDRKDDVINPGYEPPIHDFSITTLNGEDITYEILDSPYAGLLIAYDLGLSDVANQTNINALASMMMANGFKFICLTSSSEEKINEFAQTHDIPYEFCITDPTTLKTIIRSNPGLVLLKKGIIVNKWHHNQLPKMEEFLKNEIQAVEY